jgi:putative membrane protein
MRRTLTRFGLLAALAAMTATTACKAKEGSEAGRGETTAAGGALDTGMARHDSAAAAKTDSATAVNAEHNGWSDAQILAYASAANNAEISEGKLAESKAKNAQVKAFARQMVADHQTMLKDGKAFASEHKITPDTTKNDVTGLMKNSRDEVKDLTEKNAGADWDKEFLDKQIDGHKDVLDHLQDAAKGTNNAALRQMLTKASGKVQEHLTKAQALKEKYPAS